ncbi:hypothetical protein LTR37_012046 [Vermiconidia calcicola]|uniref:Uncharacterized protein n=1 Tax=Vermiconidia calcicola TaxID=1690605 RepID=A0ACC3N0Z8_9PEZI|nr:hypothetical protein LTR37_012046 [Vermiconidia calcicola]
MAPIPLSIVTRTTLLIRDANMNAAPTINVTALCIEKAAWVAHQSAEASTSTRVAMAVFTVLLGMAIVITAWCFEAYLDDFLEPKHFKILGIGTSFFVCLCACFSTYVRTVNHQFYCESNPDMSRWAHEWLVAGVALGPFVLAGAVHWLYMAISIVRLDRVYDEQLPMPFPCLIFGGVLFAVGFILVGFPMLCYAIWQYLGSAIRSPGKSSKARAQAKRQNTTPVHRGYNTRALHPYSQPPETGMPALPTAVHLPQYRDESNGVDEDTPPPPYSRFASLRLPRMGSLPPTYEAVMGRLRGHSPSV